MFPNGLVLNGARQAQVDFDPECVRMMLDFFVQARTTHAAHFSEEAYLTEIALDNRNIASAPQHHPLFTKPMVIVLREELDYYILPAQQHAKPSTSTMTSLKTAGGHYLQQQNQVFEALLRNISKENNMAEQHLVDILCKAGFSLEDTWNYRALEPKRTCISSLSLVHLETSGPQRRMATAQKLMMFYGKPAVSLFLFLQIASTEQLITFTIEKMLVGSYMCRIDGYAGATVGTTYMDLGIGTRVTRSTYYNYDDYHTLWHR